MGCKQVMEKVTFLLSEIVKLKEENKMLRKAYKKQNARINSNDNPEGFYYIESEQDPEDE